jgi:multiple sugar transport system permease protein
MVETGMAGTRAVNRWGIGRMLTWALLIFLIILTLFPLWVVLKTALTPTRELFSAPLALFPENPTLFNFRRVLGLVSTQENVAAGGSGQSINFLRSVLNSTIFTTLVVVLQTFFSALAAYAFARLRFIGREIIFFCYLAALMLPGAVLFLPNFVLIKNLGWLNTYQGMIAPFALMSPFAVFFLRQFFLSVPKELEEAAKLDGASPFGTFWRIILPTSMTPIATLVILTGIGAWNEFFWPYLVAGSSDSMRVLPVALQFFRTQTPQGAPDWTGLMAATFLSIIPIFILLIVLGRKVINSLQFSGLK